ncbi:hypothetical protein [Oceanimonas smirnovii]|uniref:Lipoprotein n=1 Tax=Oceanimonas smirnovii TaxID=264574 RepID=A0ABW7NXZ2_9GAMM
MKKITLTLLFLFVSVCFAFTYKLYMENEKLREENLRKNASIEIYKNASTGLIPATTESKALVEDVINHVATSSSPKEKTFKSCWERQLQTGDWGSMGPVGLLESCIDKISNDKTAILMKKVDSSFELIGYECMPRGNSRYDGIEKCNIDGSYILLSSAKDTLFRFITEDDWMNKGF